MRFDSRPVDVAVVLHSRFKRLHSLLFYVKATVSISCVYTAVYHKATSFSQQFFVRVSRTLAASFACLFALSRPRKYELTRDDDFRILVCVGAFVNVLLWSRTLYTHKLLSENSQRS
jgi:hypothetical protein